MIKKVANDDKHFPESRISFALFTSFWITISNISLINVWKVLFLPRSTAGKLFQLQCQYQLVTVWDGKEILWRKFLFEKKFLLEKKMSEKFFEKPSTIEELQKLFSLLCRSLSWNVRKTNILLTLMCIGAHKFIENSLLLISFSRLTSFYWSGKRAFAGFCCVHKYLCNRLKETSGLEDWFIDSKPDELKFIGITYIVESKKRIRRKSPSSQNFFFWCIEKEIFPRSTQ